MSNHPKSTMKVDRRKDRNVSLSMRERQRAVKRRYAAKKQLEKLQQSDSVWRAARLHQLYADLWLANPNRETWRRFILSPFC